MTSPTENTSTITSISAYGFYDVLKHISPYLKDNFKFDFDSIENYPRSFGTNFHFAILEVSEVEPEVPTESTTKASDEETKTVKVRGRTKQEKPVEG